MSSHSKAEEFGIIFSCLVKTNRRLTEEIRKAKENKDDKLLAILESIKKETGFITLNPSDSDSSLY